MLVRVPVDEVNSDFDTRAATGAGDFVRREDVDLAGSYEVEFEATLELDGGIELVICDGEDSMVYWSGVVNGLYAELVVDGGMPLEDGVYASADAEKEGGGDEDGGSLDEICENELDHDAQIASRTLVSLYVLNSCEETADVDVTDGVKVIS